MVGPEYDSGRGLTAGGLVALDLFAGVGWGVACQRLGIRELGVEIEPVVREARRAAGMSTVFEDVWDGLRHPSWVPGHDMLIASPPCQTFTLAGSGAGRRALDDVLTMIERGACVSPGSALEESVMQAEMDVRTGLVLAPLAYAWRWRPRLIALEQVSAVLPVWEAYAAELEEIGYSVAVGNLQAEQYGVPQTRRRAFLVARSDGKQARLPEPTHSKYHTRSPERLDPGVPRFVSMADALGRGVGTLLSTYSTHGDYQNRGERTEDQPSSTLTGKSGRMKWIGGREERMTPNQAAALQTFPEGFPFKGNKGQRHQQIGNAVPPLLAEAILAELVK